MSEEKSHWFEPDFNRSVKIRVRDQRLSSDGGVLLLREADQRLGLIDSIGSRLHDPRDQEKIRYTLRELLRERIFAQAQGYGVDDDVDRLAHDPAMRIATWDRPGEQVLQERMASQPTQSRLIDTLVNFKGNLEAMRGALAEWVERHLRATGSNRAVLRGTVDVDSFPINAYGSQEGAAYHGYYREKIYHPLVASFAPEGDYDSRRLGDGFVHAILRAGNADSAQGAVRFIRETLKKCSSFARTIDVRFDAAFAEGWILDALTDDGTKFVGRLKANATLDAMAKEHLRRPVGRPPTEGYEKVLELFYYQAESWRHAQRIILVIIDKPDPKTGQLEFFPHHFYLVTNRTYDEMSAEEVLEHYRRRGTFEDRIGELQQTVSPHLSSPRFEENEADLLVSLLSYNLLAILRGELEVASSSGWDLGRLQRSVLKAGVRVTRGGRRLFVDLALAVVPLWNYLVQRITSWRLPERWPKPNGPRKRTWIPPPAHAHLSLVLRE